MDIIILLLNDCALLTKLRLKPSKKYGQVDLHENMLIIFHCPEKLPSCKLTIKDFFTTAKLLTQPSDKSDMA